MSNILILGVLVVAALVLGAMLLKKPGSTVAEALSLPVGPSPKPDHKYAEELAIMQEWYLDAKKKEFQETVLKDVVEKFSKPAVKA